MWSRVVSKRLREPLPEVFARGRIVEQIPCAEDRIDLVSAAEIQDSGDRLHPRARERALRFF